MENLQNAKNAGGLSGLKNLIAIGEVSEELKTFASDAGVKLITFDEVVNAGKSSGQNNAKETSPDDLYMISYSAPAEESSEEAKCYKFTHKMLMNAA